MDPLEPALRRYFETARPRGIVAAYLFGSRARGAAHRESDVDVAVLFERAVFADRDARAREAVRLATNLIGATHENQVDVVPLNDAPPELAVAAVSAGRRIYCTDAEADHAFLRTVLLRQADLRPFLARARRVKLRALAR